MSSNKTEKTSLGSVELFAKEFDRENMDLKDDTRVKELVNELMKEILGACPYRFGHTKGGASINYTPEAQEDSDDLGFVKIYQIIKETVELEAGTLTYNGQTLAQSCPTAHESILKDPETNKEIMRIVRIGGLANQNNTIYVFLALHRDNVNGNTYNIIVGKNTGGFSLAYAPSGANTYKVKISAEPMDDSGTLYIYAEDIVGETFESAES